MPFRLVLEKALLFHTGTCSGVFWKSVYRIEMWVSCFGGTGVSVSDAQGNYVPLGENQ